MKRIYLTLISILLAIPLLAQTHNDYIEDGVSGSVDRAFNGILWMIIIAVVLVVLLFVSGGILEIYYWFNPDKKVTREQEIKVLSDLLDKATEKKGAPKPLEKVAKQEEPVKTEVKKPTPKPIKKNIELEIVAKKVWVNVNSENRVNKEVVYSYIDSINFEGKDILDDIGDTILKSPALFSYKGISIDTRDLPEEAFIPDLAGTQIDKVLIFISGDFTPSKLHLIAVEDIDTNWLFHPGYVIYDGELIRLHLQIISL